MHLVEKTTKTRDIEPRGLTSRDFGPRLKDATSDELLREFAGRTLATVVIYDALVEVEPGKVVPRTMNFTAGLLTQIYGLVSLHAANIADKIEGHMRNEFKGGDD